MATVVTQERDDGAHTRVRVSSWHEQSEMFECRAKMYVEYDRREAYRLSD